MSESQKRPGVRDISDLKARLGLKKSGATASIPAAVPFPAGGVVPPPGVRLPGRVPPPPGAAPPPGSAPVAAPPTAPADPFGAMNAMAAQAIAAPARGPEIIVVNAGEHVEKVNKKASSLAYAKAAATVLVPLIVGAVIGQTAHSAKAYNKTLDDSGMIAEDITRVRKSLVTLSNVLATATLENNYALDEAALKDALDVISKAPPAFESVYKSNMYELDPMLVGQIFEFYTDSIKLRTELKEHIEQTGKDADTMQKGAHNLKAAGPDGTENKLQIPYRFGLYALIPTEAEAKRGVQIGGQIVEVGAPVCTDGKTSTTGECPGPPMGFNARSSATGGWAKMLLAAPKGEANDQIAHKQLLLLQQNDLFDSLVKGTDATIADRNYAKRVEALKENTQFLLDAGRATGDQLSAKSGESRQFTFFM